MENDAYTSKSKNKNAGQDRGPLLSAYIAILGIATLGAILMLIMPTINFLLSIGSDVSDLLDLGDTDGVAFIVARTATLWLVGIGGYGIAWLLLFLAARAIRDALDWEKAGYNTLQSLGGLAIIGGFVVEDWRVAAAGALHLVILFALAHIRFYPEYEGKTFGEYLRDLNFINIAWQSVFVVLIIGSLKFLWLNVYNNLLAQNLLPTFTFLDRRAGFGINQSPEWYSSNSTYGMSFFVGVVNTLQVVSVGLVMATVLGILLGVFLLSNNWLIKTISRGYVEILRNTPLLVQLLFWYFVVLLQLLPEDDIMLLPESVMVIQLRWIFFGLAFLGMWIWSMRQPDKVPRRSVIGVFFGTLILEISARLIGESYAVIVILAIVGAVLIFLSRQEGSIPEGYEGLPFGIGLLAIIQVGWYLLMDALHSAEVISHSRAYFDEVLPAVFIGRTGFVVPEIILTVNFTIFGTTLLAGMVVAIGMYLYWGGIIDRTGKAIPRTGYSMGLVILFGIVGWMIASSQALPDEITIGEGDEAQVVTLQQAQEEELLEKAELLRYESDPLIVVFPERNRFKRVLAGTEFDPSYMALLIGLVVYTSAFIGEIVRAGIQAVPFGQIEAARALGLSQAQTLRMIVLPQALRVIIPPMGNQYLNLSKNSSLATAIAFSDTYQVGQTIMNQSGQSITGFFLVLLVYLTLSLIISFFMNMVNARFQLVTR